MEVRLFGELEVLAGGVPVPVRGAKLRTLLAVLALQRGQPVSADRLIDVLWGGGQAANPANALQAQIGQLRRILGAAAIATSEAGYALAAGPGEVDVVRFEQLVTEGRRLAAGGALAAAAATLGEALGLRRGEPLAEFTDAGFFAAERARLDELALVATESRAGADLGLGRHADLAGELAVLCREHPLRERLWELLILALYRSGRQAEALRAYAEVRDHLAGELGLDPGPALRELQARILAQDPSLGSARRSSQPGSGPGGRSAGGSWPPGRYSRAGPPARDEVLCPEVTTRPGAASAADRAAGPWHRVEVDARLRARWLRQDDAAHRVAGGGPGRAGR